ncbi:MAG: NAD(P)H-dependent glycerol-3-phosphate dehydrogenase [Dehalococcoidales bacterium]
MSTITVIGTTTWGKTLCVVFARKGLNVRLWARTEHEATNLSEKKVNNPEIPGGEVPDRLYITSDIEKATAGTEAVVLAVPSHSMRDNIRMVKNDLDKKMLVISAAKGFELNSNKRMSQVIAEEIPAGLKPNICILSGPNLSREISMNWPAATVLAASSEDVAERARRILTGPGFCVYTNTDITGVELGGALKNIIALGAGMVDGLGFGDNTRAAFITRGLTEIAALGAALGANPLTFSGLAGLGDLIATCTSSLSRNHYVGYELAKGRQLDDIRASMKGVAEGVNTTRAAIELSRKLSLGMPVTERIYQVLFEGASPEKVVSEVVPFEARHELDGENWKLFSFTNHPNHG